MKIGINIVLLAAILLGSCAREPIEEQHPLGAGEVQIKLTLPGDEGSPSRAAGDYDPATEDALHKVQLFIYDPALNPDLTSQLLQTITFTKETPKASENMVWDRKAGIITLRNTLTPTKAYTIFAVANPDVTITPPDKISEFQARSWANKQPIAAPNTSTGLVMSQRVSDYIFANHDSKLEMSLTRLASKVRVKVVLDPILTTLYPDFTFSLAPGDTAPKLQALGIPNKSFLFPPVPPMEYTTTPSETTLAKLNEVPPSTKEEGVWVMYLPEHPLLGKFDAIKDKATSFVLTLPYTIKNSINPPVVDNYYVVTVQNPTSANPCQILRNTFYDVTVTVKALGNSIPTISGSEIEAQVLPWNSAQIDQDSGTLSVLELSNAYCKIYGDNADTIMIATATLNRTGLSGRAVLTRTGNGFEFSGTKATSIEKTLTNGELDTINISTNSTFRGGKVTIKIGNEEQTITIDRDFDYGAYGGRMTIHGTSIRTDAEWCLISRDPYKTKKEGENIMTTVQTKYIQSTAPTTAYINPLKITLVDTPRQAQITAVIKSTEGKETLTRVVIIQQPYIEHLKTKWATGNICLGYRPDGQRCFIIGGAHEPSLFFQHGQMIGLPRRLSATKIDWNDHKNAWFPSQSGPTALAVLKTGADVANNYKELVIGLPAGAGYEPKYPGDPCEYIYNSDKTITWRTPTQAELIGLQTNAKPTSCKTPWDNPYHVENVNQLDEGAQIVGGKLFLPVTGRIDQTTEGRYIQSDDALTKGVYINLFGSNIISGWDGSSLSMVYEGWPSEVNASKVFGFGIRCVRKEIK